MTAKGRTYIIAEAGVNHNGDPELAARLVRVAAEAGADAVKFQTFKSEQLVSRHALKAAYQERTTGSCESQLEMIRRLELDHAAHAMLLELCRELGIDFLSTPFDSDSLAFLADELKLSRLKLSSGEITNAPLLLEAARTGLPVILSTGMSTLGEVEDALGVLAYGYLGGGEPGAENFRSAYCSAEGKRMLLQKVSLLHCTTEYPAPLDEVNLRAMDTLRDAFGLPVGFSDHTPGIHVPVAAVARQAEIMEKHFTLDRTLPGPDHAASLEPQELKEMVRAIRQVELALGSPVKGPSASEVKNMAVARKSLVALRPVAQGELFSAENLTTKRPGSGISPMRFWDYLGQPAQRPLEADDLLP